MIIMEYPGTCPTCGRSQEDSVFGRRAPANDEAVRLREIEHLAWHILDNTEERDDCWIIDKEISGDDMRKLTALLPENHPATQENK